MDSLHMIKQYRDLSISMEELSNVIDVNSFAPPEYSYSIIICNEHATSVLEKYKQNEVTELDIARWAKFIMLSEWYDYCEESYETIASVVANLEAPLLWGNYADGDCGELNEFMGKLSPEKADSYINALKNNTEI
ncbi:hypothetical protein HWN40_04615 [Methanolobus zinderi]|uniref:Uncharacterized protein n=1 Tax=Methanolobus zinderi TaxID=536044 RepID=A0A7D5I087_9EURY|nr:hypothetical protein [Methanolobus zinderi]KXS40218.1 MAG: hypothetical protein AWU59_2622 [Methanolobus sp. T82-4]QLC49586.1 hypothetical protein HWN40_04615 [Methanolobus zinderi]